MAKGRLAGLPLLLFCACGIATLPDQADVRDHTSQTAGASSAVRQSQRHQGSVLGSDIRGFSNCLSNGYSHSIVEAAQRFQARSSEAQFLHKFHDIMGGAAAFLRSRSRPFSRAMVGTLGRRHEKINVTFSHVRSWPAERT